MSNPIVCAPRSLPRDQWVAASQIAARVNPTNRPPIEQLARLVPGFVPTPDHIAVVTSKRWHTVGVRLTVGFLDNPPPELRAKILAHMNAWNKTANVSFVEGSKESQVRITRSEGGYWSYVGTDILSIEADQPTMNLEAFTMSTPDSEFHRIVRHETGHTLGFPHEHMRRELVARVDVNKAIDFFAATQGWSAEVVRQQVLTPLEESSLYGTPHTDSTSIMCYQIPGTITVDGKPIVGGVDIDPLDYEFAGKIYPLSASAPAPARAMAAVAPLQALHLARPVMTITDHSESVLLFAPGATPAYIAAVASAMQKSRSAASESLVLGERDVPAV